MYGPGDGATHPAKGQPPPFIQWTGREFTPLASGSNPEDTDIVYILLDGERYVQYPMIEYEAARAR